MPSRLKHGNLRLRERSRLFEVTLHNAARGDAVTKAAEPVALPPLRTSAEVEADYVAFCKAGRPIMTALIFCGAFLLIAAALGVAEARTGNDLLPVATWFFHHGVEFCFAAPAIIAAIRGRRYLKSILLGKLLLFGVLVIGIAGGSACVLFSSIVGLSYFSWPALHLQGLGNSADAPLITAYLLGPFGEEMLYQVGVQTWLQRFGPIVPIIGATLPFWGFHLYGGFRPMHDALIFTLPGTLAFALIRQTTKSFGASILAHSTANVLVSCLQFTPR